MCSIWLLHWFYVLIIVCCTPSWKRNFHIYILNSTVLDEKSQQRFKWGGEGLLLVSIGFRGREKFVRLGHGKGPSTAARQARGPSATARQAVSPSESNASRERAERERERILHNLNARSSKLLTGQIYLYRRRRGGAGDAAKGMGKIANLPLSLRPSLGNWFFALECVCVNKTRLVVYLLHM